MLEWNLEVEMVIVKSKEQCLSFSISWMDLKHQTRSRPFLGLEELIERLNSQIQMKIFQIYPAGELYKHKSWLLRALHLKIDGRF
ncbi:unnamed protein product [Lactuca virosa]|uniref:Uncharacterized protein n=1 Tax=Lactuca virosa TaxID=75947 RepID=A0AAU9PL59_9ASTR|nr:unnamed protein product [Lactuca virosa]